MDTNIVIVKVNKSRLWEKRSINHLEELTINDIQELKEDEVTSSINVFERYFEKKELSYPFGRYIDITSELGAMIKYLERRLTLACDKTDWYFRLSEQIYEKMDEWKDHLEDSVLLLKQDKV